MNAVLLEKHEVLVLTNEAIEVHLSYLRPAVEAMQIELPELRKEMRALDEKLSGKIDALDEKLNGKIDTLDERLNGKIDALDEKLNDKIDALEKKLDGKIDALGSRLSEKTDHLADQFRKLQGSMDGLKWFISSLALIVSGISIAHSLSWI